MKEFDFNPELLRKMEIKHRKLSRPIDPDASLSDIFGRLTIEQLKSIASRHYIKYPSNLRKAELIERLSETIRENFPIFVQLLPSPSVNLILGKEEFLDERIIREDAKEQLSSFGIGIDYVNEIGEYDLFIPKELIKMTENVENIDEKAFLNFDILLTIIGAMRLYGKNSLAELEELISKQIGGPVPEEIIINFLVINQESYIFGDISTDDYGDLMMEYMGFDEELFIERDDLERVPLREEDRVSLYLNGVPKKCTIILERLNEFLIDELNMNPEFADYMIGDFIDDCYAGTPFRAVVEEQLGWNDFEDKKQLNAFVKMLQDTHNNLPKWELKGACPEDLFQGEVKKLKKVGRNDPCPCGSGKKYKHCCLGKDEAERIVRISR